MACRVCAINSPTLPFCQCGALQDYPEGLDVFETLGVAPELEPAMDPLRARFLELSKQLHPDRFVNALPPEPHYALRWSTNINGAYQILRDIGRRSEALLDYFGVPLSGKKGSVPIELAEFYFEAQESDDENAVAAEIRERLVKNASDWKSLADHWPKTTDKTLGRPAAEKLRENIIARRYLVSMAQDIERRQRAKSS